MAFSAGRITRLGLTATPTGLEDASFAGKVAAAGAGSRITLLKVGR